MNSNKEHGRPTSFPTAAAAAATAAAAADANTAAHPGRWTHANLHGVEAVAAAAAAAVWLTQQETAPGPHYASRSGAMSETGVPETLYASLSVLVRACWAQVGLATRPRFQWPSSPFPLLNCSASEWFG